MAELILECRVFEVRFRCEQGTKSAVEKQCEGQMRPVQSPPIAGPGGRPLFRHKCTVCSDVKFLPIVYPTIITLPIGEPIPKEWEGKLGDNVEGVEKSRIALQ